MSRFTLTIARRLQLAFAGIVVVLAGTAAVGHGYLSNFNDEVETVNTRTVPNLLTATNLLMDVRMSAGRLDDIQRGIADPASLAREVAGVRSERSDIAAGIEALQQRVANPEARSALDEVVAAEPAFDDATRQILAHAEGGQPVADVAASADPLVAAIEHLVDVQTALTAGKHAATAAAYSSATLALLTLGLAGTAIAAVTAFLATRTVRRRIAQANAVAECMARGDLTSQVDLTVRDEIGELLSSLTATQDVLQRYVAAERTLASEHAAGFISRRIDAGAFEGVFADAAHEVNALVAGHIDVKMRAVETARRYAIGDFSVDMDRLPNEKAVLTETLDRMKLNLQSMTGEVQSLVEAARAGNLQKRGDAQRFEYGFRGLVEGVNATLDAIAAPLDEVSKTLAAVAAGDLTRAVDGDFRGAFGTLRDDANATVANLKDLTGRIRTGAEAIAASASEIAAGNAELSTRTEQQAASLEETASSVEELSGTIRQNADNAVQASQLAVGARDVALKGGAVVRDVVQTMDEISRASARIADIIGVIDGIAFQTNILALNAAVEAARAGDHGRGFAVVATEVRNLAQRSAAAAKEIKTLIGDSTDKVAAGSALVAAAGTTMDEIVTSVRRVTDIMAEISAASQEQATGVAQLSGTIAQMDQATQQNAAMVEEVSAAAQSLRDESTTLVGAAQQFKLTDAAAVAPGVRVERELRRIAAVPQRPRTERRRPRAELALAGNDWSEF